MVDHDVAGIYILSWPESKNAVPHNHLRTGCKIAATFGNMDWRRRKNVLQESSKGRKRGISEQDKSWTALSCCLNVSVIDFHGNWNHFVCVHMQLDPKRLKKDLPKSLKLIKGEDRVLIMGTTNDPLSADIKSLCKMYSKIILIPRPDYGSRYSKNKHIEKLF